MDCGVRIWIESTLLVTAKDLLQCKNSTVDSTDYHSCIGKAFGADTTTN